MAVRAAHEIDIFEQSAQVENRDRVMNKNLMKTPESPYHNRTQSKVRTDEMYINR